MQNACIYKFAVLAGGVKRSLQRTGGVRSSRSLGATVRRTAPHLATPPGRSCCSRSCCSPAAASAAAASSSGGRRRRAAMWLLLLLPSLLPRAGGGGGVANPFSIAAGDKALQQQQSAAPPCRRYTQLHSGCKAIPGGGPPTFCGNASLMYDGATLLPNGTVVNGKRFDWGSTAITKVLVPLTSPVASCARECEQSPGCVGFALQNGTGKMTCFPVNNLRYTITVLVQCPSYAYTPDPVCKPSCGAGSDALRLAPADASTIYQPRPAVSAVAGGVAQCAALCDRLPGCAGFSIDNTTTGLCFPTNATSRIQVATTPVLSYVRSPSRSQPRAAAEQRYVKQEKCWAVLQRLCFPALSGVACQICAGQNQAAERAAGCSVADVAKFCAASNLDWWMVPPDQHVFEADEPTMSQFCSSASTPHQPKAAQWRAVAGGTVASQLALRWRCSAKPVLHQDVPSALFYASDLIESSTRQGTTESRSSRPTIPAAALSFRQVGSVFAPSAIYQSERGAAFYPDILWPIYQPKSDTGGAIDTESVFEVICEGGQSNGSLGRRLSYDRGGRQISVSIVSIGAEGLAQCQKLCSGEPMCNGFFLAANGGCHTVNATNVIVSTKVAGVSYRRQRFGMSLVPNITRSVWVDVTVPTDATPGVYTGTVTVKQLKVKQLPVQLFVVPVTLRVWPIKPACLQAQLAGFGKGYGFDPLAVQQLWSDHQSIEGVDSSVFNFTKFMCEHHAPAEALANSWATQRPLSDIEALMQPPCRQPLFNAAFLGIANPPRYPSPENVTDKYVKHALDAIAPRMEQLRKAGLLHFGYIYAFDESKIDYAPALVRLFGAVKRRWPEVNTLSVLNWTPTPDMPLDIWVSLYPNFDQPAFREARKAFQAAGKQVWGYHCVAPRQPQDLNTFVDVPASKPRLLPWSAALHNLTGWLFWYRLWCMIITIRTLY
jgi:hypothetical protein